MSRDWNKLAPSTAGGRCGADGLAAGEPACPTCGSALPPGLPARSALGLLSVPPLHYPLHYLVFVALAAMDIVLTWLIVFDMGGTEVNALADAVIQHQGLSGTILFKFALVMLVVVNCEVVSRRKGQLGLRLAQWAVAISSFPVTASITQLAMLA